MYGLSAPDSPPYNFPVLFFRENILRHIDHLPGAASQGSFAIYATTIGSGIIDNNMLDAGDAQPLSYYNSGILTHLQNHSAGGDLIHGYDGSANKTLDDLETRISDALTMALL